MNFIWNWLGLNPFLPRYWKIINPMHGEEAKNGRGQKVIYDENVGKWVMLQNFSDKPPVTIK